MSEYIRQSVHVIDRVADKLLSPYFLPGGVGFGVLSEGHRYEAYLVCYTMTVCYLAIYNT